MRFGRVNPLLPGASCSLAYPFRRRTGSIQRLPPCGAAIVRRCSERLQWSGVDSGYVLSPDSSASPRKRRWRHSPEKQLL